jgi:hypothetical protein
LLDSTLADAFAVRGLLLQHAHAPPVLSRRSFERAIGLAPQFADAHGWYAVELTAEGRYADARREDDKAVGLDPLAPGRHVGFAVNAISAGDADIALREANRALSLEPGLSTPRAIQALALLMLGRNEECIELPLGRYVAMRALCLHTLGRKTEAKALIDSIATMAVNASRPGGHFSDIEPSESVALYYAWIGDVGGTLLWLNRATDISTSAAPFFFLNSTVFAKVRHNPEFVAGLAKLDADIWARVSH